MYRAVNILFRSTPIFLILVFVSACSMGPFINKDGKTIRQVCTDEIPEQLFQAEAQIRDWQLQQADQSYAEAVDKLRRYCASSYNVIGMVLNRRAELSRLMGQFELSEQFYKRALAIQEKAKLQKKSYMYPTYWGLGKLYADLGYFDRAEKLYEELLLLQEDISVQSDPANVRTLLEIADLYAVRGNFLKAKLQYQEILESLNRLPSIQYDLTAKVLNNYASLTLYLGNYDLAGSLYDEALEITGMSFGNLHPEYARTLLNIGYLNLLQGEYEQAQKKCNRALTIFKQYFGIKHPDIAVALNHLAQLKAFQGKYRRAEELYRQSLKVIESTYGSDHWFYATALNNLGQFYRMVGDLDTADILLERAEDIAKSALGGDHPKTLDIKYNIGLVHYYRKDYERAAQDFCAVLVGQRTIYGEDNVKIALTEYGLGQAYREQARYDIAETLFHNALSIQRHFLGDSHILVGFTLNHLALLYKKRGDNYLNTANPRLAEMDYNHAQELFMQALVVATVKDNHELLWRIQYNISDLLLSRNKPEAAIFVGKQAVNTIQNMRQEVVLMDLRLQEKFICSKEHVYRSLSAILIDEGRLPEAEQVITMLKGYEYRKIMNSVGERGGSPIFEITCGRHEDEYCEIYKAINDNLSNVAAEFRELGKMKNHDALKKARFLELQKYITAADIVFNRFYKNIIEDLDEPKRFTEIDEEVLDQSRLKPALEKTPGGAVWLNYLVRPSRLYIIITTSDIQDARIVEINSKEIHNLVKAFRDSIREKQEGLTGTHRLGRKLYDIMIAPVKEFILPKNVQLLIFSFDQGLRYLPAAALYDGKKYLVQDYAIAHYTPADETEMTSQPAKVWQVAALGLSQAAKVSEPGSIGNSKQFAALPGVEKELNSVVRENDKDPEGVMQGEKYLDDDFTLYSLVKALSDESKQVVHIATHFQFRAGQENQSYLILGSKDTLTLEYFDSLPTSIRSKDLLTLSACETAMIAESASGAEIEGLGTMLQKKGVCCVLATLWKVNDMSTAIFMIGFYEARYTGEGITKAESLRRVQQAFINDAKYKNYSSPYHWAPFLLMGNWF